jgi:hypothetical protein
MNGDLRPLLYSYFEDYLKCKKGLRSSSLKNYRASARLFLLFLAEQAHHKVCQLTLTDLTSAHVWRSFKVWKHSVTTTFIPVISARLLSAVCFW